MGRYLSKDLRIRLIRAVECSLSGRVAAARFGVGVSSAIRWMSAYLDEGRATAKAQGGDQRSGRIEAQHDFLMQVVEEAGRKPGDPDHFRDFLLSVGAWRFLRACPRPKFIASWLRFLVYAGATSG